MLTGKVYTNPVPSIVVRFKQLEKVIKSNSKGIYKERYIVYKDGSIYSNLSNKFLKEQIDDYGYGYYRLRDENGIVNHWFTHKLISEFFIPKVNGKKFINHIDGDKRNNDLDNLEWCTIAENNKHARDNNLNNVSLSNSIRWNNQDFRESTSKNMSDSRIKNETAKGRNNGNSKVDLLYNGEKWTMSELSEELGIKLTTLNNMKRRIKKGLPQSLAIKYNIKYIEQQ